MLQAWFMLLDMGLSPTLARETARFKGNALAADDYRSFVQAVEALFFVVALLGGGLLYLGAGHLASDWLKVSTIPHAVVERALQVMALIVALRWMSGLYRSIASGNERLVWLAGFGSAVATIRFIGVLLVLNYVSATITAFFWYQLAIACLELVILMGYATRHVPARSTERSLWSSLAVVRPTVKFSLSLAFTSAVWVFITQTDKLILSNILPLADYGYFTLAVLVAGGVMVISGPVSGALMPRMARLEADQDGGGLVDVYRRSTQLVVVVSASASITLALCAQSLLYAWTGDRSLASHASPVLVPYALGNGFLAISAFPYYLQYAKGNLRMHLIGNVLFVVVLFPLIVWAAGAYGGVGAGYAWLLTNALYLLAWAPLVHRHLRVPLNGPWFARDIAAIAVPMALAGLASWTLLPWGGDRWMSFASVAALFAATLLVGAASTTRGLMNIKAYAVSLDAAAPWTGSRWRG
jgi:O-antigen/teichoic acid export membrane protein